MSNALLCQKQALFLYCTMVQYNAILEILRLITLGNDLRILYQTHVINNIKEVVAQLLSMREQRAVNGGMLTQDESAAFQMISKLLSQLGGVYDPNFLHTGDMPNNASEALLQLTRGWHPNISVSQKNGKNKISHS